MKILTNSQIKEWDRYTIEHEPIASIDLMERAAQAITEAIARRWDKRTTVKVFAGPGNNGGDALAVARMLAEKGYSVEAYLFNAIGKLSDDCSTNRDLLRLCDNVKFEEIIPHSRFIPPQLNEHDVIIDGMFGSGLMCEDNTYNQHDNIIRADLTLTIGQAKLSFLFAENQKYLGEVEVLDIGLHPDYLKDVHTPFRTLERDEIAALVRPRNKFAHKGTYGHALLIAGKVGMTGASVLAARACLRSGVGLLTVHAPLRNYDILQTAVPEAMVELDYSDDSFTTASTETEMFRAIAIGPGIGKEMETAEALVEQLQATSSPMVLDADALNILAQNHSWLNLIPHDSILTPHPGELERLVGTCADSYERLSRAKELAARYGLYIIVKGANTAIIAPDGNLAFNTTGNPGMATAGSGDVLTGILLALLAQGYAPEAACRLGVYVHGLAGDLAAEAESQIAMTAGSIVNYLPHAWKQI